jgi:CspA family cold shock protein
MTGKVKFYDSLKGFGFIKEDDSDAEWFFHHSNCLDDDINRDDAVSFDEGENQRGVCAINVARL